jgi:hypothetical protein
MAFVVVCFSMDPKGLEETLAAISAPDPAAFPHRAVRVAKQAEALGGKLCAFGPRSIAFAFEDGDLEEAIALAARVVSRDEPRWMAGLAQGDLIAVQEAGSFSSLSWGRPLAVASALSESAHRGELLVDPQVPGVAEVVRSQGSRWVSGATEAIGAISVDTRQPLLRDAEDPFHDEPEEELSQSGAFVAAQAVSTADLARQALLQGDIDALDSALAELKPSGTHPALVERLAGLLALNRGAMHEGLRTLRAAADAETRPAVRTRARLAYAIGLASAGRPETALLEGLTALASARSLVDRPGEQACARFLSQLSASTGHPEAASAWEHVAELAGAPEPRFGDELETGEPAPQDDQVAEGFAHGDLDATYVPDGYEDASQHLRDLDATYVPDGYEDPGRAVRDPDATYVPDGGDPDEPG